MGVRSASQHLVCLTREPRPPTRSETSNRSRPKSRPTQQTRRSTARRASPTPCRSAREANPLRRMDHVCPTASRAAPDLSPLRASGSPSAEPADAIRAVRRCPPGRRAMPKRHHRDPTIPCKSAHSASPDPPLRRADRPWASAQHPMTTGTTSSAPRTNMVPTPPRIVSRQSNDANRPIRQTIRRDHASHSHARCIA